MPEIRAAGFASSIFSRGARQFFAWASRIHWERRLPAGKPSRASGLPRADSVAATVGQLEAGAPSRDGACPGNQREKLAHTPSQGVRHSKVP